MARSAEPSPSADAFAAVRVRPVKTLREARSAAVTRCGPTRSTISLSRRVKPARRSLLVSITIPGRTLEFTGKNYALTWVWPNFYFHYTMAYALMRHNGVILGKRDYLGA